MADAAVPEATMKSAIQNRTGTFVSLSKSPNLELRCNEINTFMVFVVGLLTTLIQNMLLVEILLQSLSLAETSLSSVRATVNRSIGL